MGTGIGNGGVRRLAIYYEHPQWFEPLLVELGRRGVGVVPIRAGQELFDFEGWEPGFDLVFNRMSPSAFLRGDGRRILHSLHFLRHLEGLGIPVINGFEAFQVETSKVRQLEILSELGLPFPRTRVVQDPERTPEAARGLRFPVVTKPNLGGSGAGIVRFDAPEELADGVRDGRVEPGLDGTLLVQEFIPAENDEIVRVEFLDGRFLYAIAVPTDGRAFNLCPADLCRPEGGGALARAVRPPEDVIEAVLSIGAAAGFDLGGVEYVVDSRDGRRYFYDVNALSNFVADAVEVVGFDPWQRLVDYLERRLALAPVPAAAGAGSG